MIRSTLLVAACALSMIGGCGGDDGGDDDAATVAFELDGALAAETYWDLPFPSDLRLTADGTPDLAGYPTRDSGLAIDLLDVARLRRGFPVVPVAYFRFTAPPPAQSLDVIIPATGPQPIEMFALAPGDAALDGRRVPVVAKTLIEDDFAPPALLAIAPLPGIVLAPDTTYAVVIRRDFAPGFEPPVGFADLVAGRTPAGARGAAAATLYAALLDRADVDAEDYLVATIFTTGDETAVLRARTEALRTAHDAVIDVAGLAVDPVDGAGHDGFCEVIGTVTFPQFQRGTPPFDTEGDFELDPDGVPIEQGTVTVPLAITLPEGREMPAAGWPLYQFFHGSGGLSSGLVDLGKTLVAGGEPEVGKGPGWVVARHGIAAVSSALPVNPERLPGAADTEYLNLFNLSAFPHTFQQGVIEQRLLLDAMIELRIPAAAVAACNLDLPVGATEHRFDPAKLVAGGQSMGGMYTNLIASVEDRYGAVVPTGAGGFWPYMITNTELIPGALELLAASFGTDAGELTFVHPVLNLLALGWEIAEPIAAIPRIGVRPLPGLAHRHIYEPVGYQDIYFPPVLYDAIALAYGNQQAGAEVWPTMHDRLAYGAEPDLATYPISNNVADPGGGMHTGVVVQYASDGIADAHYLYRQSDEVKHQYGCFLATFLATGTAVVPAPGAITDPCE